MINTIAVGTDGSETAQRAVTFAIEMAERYGAGVVVASSYTPVREDRLKKEQEGAPREVHWAINPMEQVEPALRDAEDAARARGSPSRPTRAPATPPTCCARWPRSMRRTCWWWAVAGCDAGCWAACLTPCHTGRRAR